MIEPANDATIKKAAELLRGGGLIALPTETVYGLAADAQNDQAVAGIFALKGRPQFNPLIIHVSDAVMAKRLVTWNDAAETLAAAFWPGPLTLVLPRRTDSRVSLLASAGGDTLGVRMPAHAVARKIIEAAGVPLAAPSANRSGRVSPTSPQHVEEEFGGALALIVDGGVCSVGIESSVVDLCGASPFVLRPGFVTREQVEQALGRKVLRPAGETDRLKSPGQLASHYAPSLPVRLDVARPHAGEALLAFGPAVPPGAKTVINLSETGDLREAAGRLFAALRQLDTQAHAGIAVMPIPEEGLGVAINDRLRRAAHPRG